MKIFYLSKSLLFLVLFLGISNTYAQGFISEVNRISNSHLKSKVDFEKQDYTKIKSENGNSVYIQNSTESENKIASTLTVELDFDPALYTTPWVISIYNESGYTDYAFSPVSTTVEFQVPPGIYEVMADFYTPGTLTSNIIIKEMVDVTANTEITIVAAEANNYITANTFDENGEPLEPGVYNPQTDTYSNIFFDRIIRLRDSNYAALYLFRTGEPFQADPIWNFYMNDVSDRYDIGHTFMGMLFGEDTYYSKFETLSGNSNSVDLTNDPTKWAIHIEKFQPSPLGELEGIYPAYKTVTTHNNALFKSDLLYLNVPQENPEEGFRYFLNNTVDDDPFNFLIVPTIVDYMGLADPTWVEEPFLLGGNTVYSDANGNVQYGSGSLSFNYYFINYDYFFDGSWFTILPFHPKLSFSKANNPNVLQGNNTPIAITATKVVPNEMNYINVQYKGNYGEIRESDFFATEVEAKHNGIIIFSGSYIDYLWQYGIYSAGLPTNGDIEFSLTNSNIEVDGLPGKNSTKLSYNASEADVAPTLQALQFRNGQDEVSNRFESASDGSIRLSGADYNLEFISNGNSFFTYNEGNTVELFYSLYNQNTWSELELTEYPEYFQMPAFGNYYEASLANVNVSVENSWFDVKVISTDASGNKQEQVISPAFKIQELNLSNTDFDTSGFVAYPNPFNDKITFKIPDYVKGDFVFTVTDITGRSIYSENKNGDSSNSFVWNGAALSKGVYVMTISCNGSVINKKIIKN